MESIPGYRIDLNTDEFKKQLREHGIVLTGQSADLAPADGKLYALRDVTGTVPSIPLIASSIMSKKIAGGAQAIVLDVKVGHGAFMETLDQARELAGMMDKIGELSGRKTVCLLSDMNQPLGRAVGNALEVAEAIDALHGGGPADLREHCLHVSAHMLCIGKHAQDLEEGRRLAEKAIADGTAFQKFRELVKAQGGDVSFVDVPVRLPRATEIESVPSPASGWLSQVDARSIGEASVALGSGRASKADAIDHSVGFEIHHKVGDRVEAGDRLFTIHANDARKLADARQHVLAAHSISDRTAAPLPLFYD
jgi:pyrimidine-nucleoside phosphorylase